MSSKVLNLSIYSPELLVYSGQVDSLIVPSKGGDIGILPNHTPLISSLRDGLVRYSKNNEEKEHHITSGVIKVLDNQVDILIYS